MNEIVEAAYTNPAHPGSFSGSDKLHHALKERGIGKSRIEKWLSGHDDYTLHRRPTRHFPRARVKVGGIDSQWDADLADMQTYASSNDGYKFILIAIDILSRYLWTRALKSKKGIDVKSAFRDIFSHRKPRTIRTDKGQEFNANVVQKYFLEEGVHHFQTQNEVKASFAERVIKTLKMRLSRYFSLKQNNRWIDVLQDFTDSYNATYHRSIKRTPRSVTKDNEVEVWQIQYDLPKPRKREKKAQKPKSRSPFKYKIGDFVRISHLRNLFDREYDERWSGEVFKISKRFVKQGFPMYRLDDILGDVIKGSFYQIELQKVLFDPEGSFKVEKILKTRKRKGHVPESFVRWLHWPKKFDSWVPTSEVRHIKARNP